MSGPSAKAGRFTWAAYRPCCQGVQARSTSLDRARRRCGPSGKSAPAHAATTALYSFRLLGIVVPILYWLFNLHTVQADVAQTLAYYLPYFISQVVIMGWMAQGRVMPVMSDVTQLLAATQIVKAVAHGLIKPRGDKFHVTAKGGDRSRRLVQWPMLKLFVALLTLTVGGVVWAFVFEDGSKLRDSSALCLFWSWYNILILTIACVVCVEQPRLRSSERLPAHDVAVVDTGNSASAYRILDISLGGARFEGTAPAEPGAIVSISLDRLRMSGTIIRHGVDGFAVGFNHTRSTRAHLIRFIYSGRHSAAVLKIVPARVAAAVLGRVMR
jgi:cellulose synthase (UDP-forming)